MSCFVGQFFNTKRSCCME